MLRLTRTAIGLLTAQYRSVLRKCWAINVGVFSLMGKAAASVASGTMNALNGALSAFGVNIVDVLSMMRSLDGMLGIQRHPDVEHRGTEGSSDALGITSFLQNDWILRPWLRMTRKGATLPTALVAATVALTALPTEAEALRWCIATSATTTPLRLVDNSSSCPSGYAIFGTQSRSDSSAFGYGNNASGKYSSAFGANNTASEVFSSAFGYQNTASGSMSSAFGYSNEASAWESSAFGNDNTASGKYSSAFGDYNTAYGSGSLAFGHHAQAGNSSDDTIDSSTMKTTSSIDRYATAVGSYVQATGLYALALGNQKSGMTQTTASGTSAIAIGTGAQATHDNSVAIGTNSVSAGEDTISVGNSTTQRQIKYVAAGTSDTDAVTVGQMNAALANAGKTYTGSSGISVSGTTISLDSTYLDNNYYRKNEKSGILNGVKEGKIRNKIGDFSQFRADNDNFATVENKVA